MKTDPRSAELIPRARGEDWELAASIVWPDSVRWAVGSFKPFKSVGPDGIPPVLLQQELGQVIGPLTRTLRACIVLGYTPKAWKLVTVVFISKLKRIHCTSAKDIRSISLTSFLLKTLEKLVDAYLRDMILVRQPLYASQRAYTAGLSTETALHSLVTQIEGQLECSDCAVGIFLDIEGAFNNTPHEVVCREAMLRGIPDRLVCWIRRMLRRRVLTLLGDCSVSSYVECGCP